MMKMKSVVITMLFLFLTLILVPIYSTVYADSNTKEEVPPIIPDIVKTQSHGEGGW